MNTKAIGDISEAMVIAALLRAGNVVLKPIGDNQRYDMVIDQKGIFYRIQCKTGRLKDGAVTFSSCSNHYHRGNRQRPYQGEIDFFGVYCPANDGIYLVPVGSVGIRQGNLRIDPAKNNMSKGIRLAREFEIK